MEILKKLCANEVFDNLTIRSSSVKLLTSGQISVNRLEIVFCGVRIEILVIYCVVVNCTLGVC